MHLSPHAGGPRPPGKGEPGRRPDAPTTEQSLLLGPGATSSHPLIKLLGVLSNAPLLAATVYAALSRCPVAVTVALGLSTFASICYHALQAPITERQSSLIGLFYLADVVLAVAAGAALFTWAIVRMATDIGSVDPVLASASVAACAAAGLLFLVGCQLHRVGHFHQYAVVHSAWHVLVSVATMACIAAAA